MIDFGRGNSAINSFDAISIDTLKSNEREILELKFEPNKTRHKFLSKDCKHIYHLGIIDYLQDFNIEKKFEYYAKTLINKKNAEISAVPPARYSKRFLDFMRTQVIIDQRANAANKNIVTKESMMIN